MQLLDTKEKERCLKVQITCLKVQIVLQRKKNCSLAIKILYIFNNNNDSNNNNSNQ